MALLNLQETGAILILQTLVAAAPALALGAHEASWPISISNIPELISILIAEVILSCDNIILINKAANELPRHERHRALKWGFFGALAVRATSLGLMTFAKSFYWVALIGALHMLLYAGLWLLGIHEAHEHHKKHPIGMPVKKDMGLFKTILFIESADFCFSIDNVAVAVTISKNIWVSGLGVAAGLFIVRFFWGNLRQILKRYPTLVDTSYILSALLGLQTLAKLVLHLQISPWLNLGIVTLAILVSLAWDSRRYGAMLHFSIVKASRYIVFAVLLALSFLFHK